MILVGELSLWVALLLAAWAAIVSFAGGMQRRPDLTASGERGMHATLAMLLLASLGLWTALVTRDLSLEYVASYSSANLPLVYTLAAFWGGPAGALLLFALLLAACAIAAVIGGRRSNPDLLPYLTGTIAIVLTFLVGTLCLAVNPYERLDWVPLDGRGMNPVLQIAGMMLQPPVLYAGLAATAVPFALAIAALLARRADGGWRATTRSWVTASWILLTLGIVAGMWWAYGQPDWDGEWTRDSIENAALFPWLATTLLLHALGVRERRTAPRSVAITLMLLVFPLALFSAFLGRGGVISSAHSFAQSPVSGWVAPFLVVIVGAATYLLLTRLHGLDEDDESRAATSPAPRRLGPAVLYAGLVITLVALVGQAWREEHSLALGPGVSRELRDPFGRTWQLTSQGVSQYNELNRSVVAAGVEVARGGSARGIVTSERRQYVDSRGAPIFEPVTTAGILGLLEQDVYITLAGVGDDETVRLRVGFHPLVIWVWIGGAVMALGGMLLLAATASRRVG